MPKRIFKRLSKRSSGFGWDGMPIEMPESSMRVLLRAGTAAVWEWEWEVPKEVMATEGWKAAEWKAGWAAWKAVRGLKVVAWKEEWKAAEWKAGWRVVLQVPGTRRTIDISVLQRRRSSSQEKAKKFALRSKMCSPAMRLMRLPSVSKFAFACEWSRVKFIA